MKALRIVGSVLLALVGACAGGDTPSTARPHLSLVGIGAKPVLGGGRVVLVTLDGVRWQEVFHGVDTTRSSLGGGPEVTMPRTNALVREHGVALGAGQPGCGAVRTAGGSNVSLPGYMEIFSGRVPACRDNLCPRISTPTVMDEAAWGIDGTATSITSWPIIANAATSSAELVGVAAGTRAWEGPRPENAQGIVEKVAATANVDSFPGAPGYRPDAVTAAIALEYLKTEKPTVMHVGLGDTDEFGHKDDYPRYLAALRLADDMIGAIADLVTRDPDDADRTTVIVTSDHGRAYDFKDHGFFMLGSERTFVLAFGAHVKPRGVACARDHTLADIAPTIRALVGLPRDDSDDAGAPITEVTGG